jgi:hypothetical protein
MFKVFVDESGVAANESLSAVVAVIMDEGQIDFAETALKLSIQTMLPAKHREGFIFHATDLINKAHYRDGWSDSDRYGFIYHIMSLARKIGASIVIGMVKRDSDSILDKLDIGPVKFREHELQPALAFNYCLFIADEVVRKINYCETNAIVIAENTQTMERYLKIAFSDLVKNPQFIKADEQLPTQAQLKNGDQPTDRELSIKVISDELNFVGKGDNTMLQLADACAYGIRRYFARQKNGELMIEQILGYKPDLDDFNGPSSAFSHISKERMSVDELIAFFGDKIKVVYVG